MSEFGKVSRELARLSALLAEGATIDVEACSSLAQRVQKLAKKAEEKVVLHSSFLVAQPTTCFFFF
jgi:hypothetical protein